MTDRPDGPVVRWRVEAATVRCDACDEVRAPRIYSTCETGSPVLCGDCVRAAAHALEKHEKLTRLTPSTARARGKAKRSTGRGRR